jgi:hypothetical protein
MSALSLKIWGHCFRAVVAVLIGGLAVTGCGGSDSPSTAIGVAIRAPYTAFIRREASTLCADFTPAAAAQLARRVSRSSSCQARVAEAFARSEPFERKFQPAALATIRVSGVMQHGDVAGATINYSDSRTRVLIELVKINDTWRVATRPLLGLIKGCFVRGLLTVTCPTNARVMLFSIGEPELRAEHGDGVNGQQLVRVPSAVKDAGGKRLDEFNAGMTVVVRSGCLACHRIGLQGNSGPGQNLTHVGSTLSGRQIEHAILDPTAPMPSFKNLPATKLKNLVYFLSMLR